MNKDSAWLEQVVNEINLKISRAVVQNKCAEEITVLIKAIMSAIDEANDEEMHEKVKQTLISRYVEKP